MRILLKTQMFVFARNVECWRRMHIFLSMEKTGLLLNYRLQYVLIRKLLKAGGIRESTETTHEETGMETYLLPVFL